MSETVSVSGVLSFGHLSDLSGLVGEMVCLAAYTWMTTAVFVRLRCLSWVKIGGSLIKGNRTVRNHPSYRFYQGRIKILATQVVFTDAPLPHKLFEQKVVRCSGIVVSVGLDTFFGKTVVKAKSDSLVEDLFVNWYAVVTNYNPLGIACLGGEIPPLVFADVVDPIPFCGVDCQYF